MVCHCKRPSDGSFGCGDDCLNRVLNIECVQGACPCGDLCSNQQVCQPFLVVIVFLIFKVPCFNPFVCSQFQKRQYAKVEKYPCGKKGHGLKLSQDISKGQFLIEYVGEVTLRYSLNLCYLIQMWILFISDGLFWLVTEAETYNVL